MALSSTITPLLPLFPHGCMYGCSPLAYKCASRASAVPQTMRSLNGLDLQMTAQALLGQTYSSHLDLWAGLYERRKVLNHHLPSRVRSHKPPIARLSWGHSLGTILPRLHGKRSSSLGRRCARTSPRAAGSAAFARMGSLVEVAINTTSGSTL
jgi:hypothetical protein